MALATRYRKKPIVVEAIQWLDTEESLDEIQNWSYARARRVHFDSIHPEDRGDDPEMTAEVFDKLHSRWIPLRTNDWVIRGLEGEFYPCNDEVFQATYEVAE